MILHSQWVWDFWKGVKNLKITVLSAHWDTASPYYTQLLPPFQAPCQAQREGGDLGHSSGLYHLTVHQPFDLRTSLRFPWEWHQGPVGLSFTSATSIVWFEVNLSLTSPGPGGLGRQEEIPGRRSDLLCSGQKFTEPYLRPFLLPSADPKTHKPTYSSLVASIFMSELYPFYFTLCHFLNVWSLFLFALFVLPLPLHFASLPIVSSSLTHNLTHSLWQTWRCLDWCCHHQSHSCSGGGSGVNQFLSIMAFSSFFVWK